MGVSNSILASLVVIAIVVSLAGTFVSVSQLNQFQFAVTGRATDTGTATLTSSGSAAVSLPDDTIAIGSGYVWANSTYTMIDTYAGTVANGTWTAAVDKFTIQNDGTQTSNVTIASGETDAEDFICGSVGGCLDTTSALVRVKAGNSESNSCNSGLQSTLTNILTNTDKVTVTLCSQMGYANNEDLIDAGLEITVPYDAPGGARSDTMTITTEVVTA